MAKAVVIYSTSTCHFCKEAKAFFAEHNVEYTNYDVGTDAAKRDEMIQLSGQMGVPVIVIDGEVLVGSEKDMLAKKLGIAA